MNKQPRNLDLSKLRVAKATRTLDESLKDVAPMEWDAAVIAGQAQVTVSSKIQ